MKKKLGLALGAGGAKGVAHIGALQALNDNGIYPDIITGCSAGSVVGACYAYGMTPKSIYAECLKLNKSDFVDPSINVLKHKSILKSDKIRVLLEKYLKGALIEDLEKPFCCVAADLKTGKLHEFTSGDVVTAVKASCAIPIFYSPVEIQGMVLVDGGLIERTPVNAAKKLGADVTVAIDVNCDACLSGEITNIVSVALRAIDIMEHRIKNGGGKKADVTIRPDLKTIDQFKVERLDHIYKQGYRSIIDNLDKIERAIADSKQQTANSPRS